MTRDYESTVKRFPYHKVISYEGIQQILKKYTLCLGATSQFIGDVPPKNIKDIESFIKAYDLSKFNCSGKFSVIAPFNMFKQDFNIVLREFPEPIVLFQENGDERKDNFVIVTAWGDERGVGEIQKESLS